MTDIHEVSVGTDHRGLSVLDTKECLRRVAHAPVGRLGLFHEGEVLILPVNHVVLGDSIAFRSAWGSKLIAIGGGTPVSFETDGYDVLARTGWSVLVKGVVDWIEDEQDYQHAALRSSVSWLPDQRGSRWVRIRAEEISGREIAPTPRETSDHSSDHLA